jgi:hypothetical protein
MDLSTSVIKKWMVRPKRLHHEQSRRCGMKVESGRCGAVSIWAKVIAAAFQFKKKEEKIRV